MNALQNARRSTFLRHNGIFFAGSVAVGVLNYIYYPVMGRLLAPAAFGEVQTLISLFLQIAIFLTVLGLVTINVVANYDDAKQRNSIVLEFEKLALLVSAIFLVLIIVFQGNLGRLLNFESGWPFVLLVSALAATVPLTFRGAYLRGLQKFGKASFVNLLSAAGKLLFGVLFVAIGFGTNGAIGGLICAQIAASIWAAIIAFRLGLHAPEGRRLLRLPDMRVLSPELKYGGIVLMGSLFVTLQYSLDVVVVKHLFDPHTAGLYAGVASVARIIFFLTASVALVLMPMVRMNKPAAHNRSLLKKSLLLLLALGLPPLLLFSLTPERVVGAFMGQEYSSLAYLLPRLSLAVFVVSIINVFVAYYLALRRYMIAPVVAFGGFITYVLVAANHASPSAVVNSLLFGSLIMLLILLAWVGGRRLKGVSLA